MSVAAAVERDLAEIRKRDGALANSALAALALAMAAEMDDASNSATSKSMCAARLQDALERLRELTPEERKAGRLYDLKSDRSRRLAEGGAGG